MKKKKRFLSRVVKNKQTEFQYCYFLLFKSKINNIFWLGFWRFYRCQIEKWKKKVRHINELNQMLLFFFVFISSFIVVAILISSNNKHKRQNYFGFYVFIDCRSCCCCCCSSNMNLSITLNLFYSTCLRKFFVCLCCLKCMDD